MYFIYTIYQREIEMYITLQISGLTSGIDIAVGVQILDSWALGVNYTLATGKLVCWCVCRLRTLPSPRTLPENTT